MPQTARSVSKMFCRTGALPPCHAPHRTLGGPLEEEHHFARGLERVAKVVEGVPDYDGVLGAKRLSRPEYDEVLTAHKAGRVSDAVTLMAAFIRSVRLTHYHVPRDARIISFAKTHNNKVQLRYFQRKTAPWRSAAICEISACPTSRSSKIGTNFSRNLEEQLLNFISARSVVSKSLVHQIIGYCVSYCSMLRSLRGRPSIRGLIVANDHSPNPVAISMVCAMLGVRRVYLQHAEVTSAFPPLDFDYSILMSQGSEKIYRSIAMPTGQVAVLSRQPHRAGVEGVFVRIRELRAAEHVVVGLYPSSVFDSQRVATLVKQLRGNANVARVFLKAHPSVDHERAARALGIDSEIGIPEFAHVAIVGNSSVALELATKGNLVFQDFQMDPVAADYYGFVREGLAMEVQSDDLSKRFWGQHDSGDALLAAVKKRLEEGDQCLGPKEEEQFLKRLTLDIGGGIAESLAPKDELLVSLRFFPRSLLSVARGGRAHWVTDDFARLKQLDALFNDRVIDLNALYPLVDPGKCRSALDFWLIAKRVEWSGFQLGEDGVRACCQFVAAYDGSAKMKGWLETKMFDLLLRLEKFDILEVFLSSAAQFRIGEAHLNRKIALINSSQKAAAAGVIVENIYCYEHDSRLGDLEKLKIAVQCMTKFDGQLVYSEYSQVEERFLECAPASVAEEYRRLVAPVYARIGGRDRFIDVKRQPEKASELVDEICNRLLTGHGYSVVRLSDGEGYLFEGLPGFFSEEDAKNRERHWWGGELDRELRAEVVASGLDAVRNADVIGIPSIYRFLRDQSSKSRSLLSTVQGRGLVTVLQGVLGHASDTALFGDDKLNNAVFNVKENLEAMARCAQRVLVVTGAKRSVVAEALDYLEPLEVINVPTHNKTSGNERFHTSERPLPYVFANVRDSIREISTAGTLVLVGAGVAGKSFVQAAKASGGVGLDLGSALDELVDAGIHSLH